MYIYIANSYASETLYFEQSSSEHETEVFSLLNWHLIERANSVKIFAMDFSNRLVPNDDFVLKLTVLGYFRAFWARISGNLTHQFSQNFSSDVFENNPKFT